MVVSPRLFTLPSLFFELISSHTSKQVEETSESYSVNAWWAASSNSLNSKRVFRFISARYVSFLQRCIRNIGSSTSGKISTDSISKSTTRSTVNLEDFQARAVRRDLFVDCALYADRNTTLVVCSSSVISTTLLGFSKLNAS